MLPGNPYLLLFRSLVLNCPVKELAPFLIDERANASFWDFLSWNRLTPLLQHTIRKQKAEKYFPDDFLKMLSSLHHRNVARSLQIEQVLKELLPLLEKHLIKPFLLKGAALAYSVYDNPALRPMSDIDLLFTRGQEKQARDIILSMGGTEAYAEESPHTMGLWHHIPPVKYKSVTLELHNNIAASYEPGHMPVEQVTKNPGSVTIGAFPYFTLNQEMQLYHLLSHLHKHVLAGYSRLIWLADLHLFITTHRHTLHWEKLWEQAEAAGLRPHFEKYLRIPGQLLDTPLPLPVVEHKYAEEFLGMCRKIAPGEDTIGTWNMMKKLKTSRQRLHFLRGKLFPAAAYVLKKFSGRKHLILYYYFLIHWGYLRKLVSKKKAADNIPH